MIWFFWTWMLPKLNGFEVCQAIREFSEMPIIMLTAKGDDMDKILGLEYGADDYITKPFNIFGSKGAHQGDPAPQLQEIETGAAADKESHRGGRSDAGFGQPPGFYRFPRDQSDREGI